MTEQVEVRYMNADTRGIVEENFEVYFPEFGNLSLEEVLQHQESVYLSLQANNRNRASASGSTGDDVNHEQSGGQQQAVENEGESLQVSDPTSQLELDEALALSLQELENQFSSSSVDGESETDSGTAVNAEVNSAETSTEAAREDTVDPDNMTYEELQSLGEEIGTASRGLSDELLEYLPSFKYKTGFFKKEKHEDCVICCMTYRNREKLTMLPCHHQYHSDCVKKWLKINKACPVCNEEVFGS